MEALCPDDLSFDADVEIPNENDVRFIAQIAEQGEESICSTKALVYNWKEYPSV